MTEIVPGEAWVGGPYRFVAASEEALVEWQGLAQSEPTAAEATYRRLTTFPLHLDGMKQFPLKRSEQKPYWVYDATFRHRVYYAVNLMVVTVYVAAVGDIFAAGRPLPEFVFERVESG